MEMIKYKKFMIILSYLVLIILSLSIMINIDGFIGESCGLKSMKSDEVFYNGFYKGLGVFLLGLILTFTFFMPILLIRIDE